MAPSTAANPFAALILIVEADPVVRLALAAELEAQGFEVAETPDREIAASLLATTPVRAAIVDVGPPDSGTEFDFIDKIRSEHPELPLIVTSTNSVPPPPRLASVLSIEEKPYELPDIVAALNRVLVAPVRDGSGPRG